MAFVGNCLGVSVYFWSLRFSYAIRCAESVAFCTPAPAICVSLVGAPDCMRAFVARIRVSFRVGKVALSRVYGFA
jgi:hypothetical protein